MYRMETIVNKTVLYCVFLKVAERVDFLNSHCKKKNYVH